MARDLSRLFRPRRIAVIGGGAWGEGAVKACLALGFEGALDVVHPRRAQLAGHPCVPSIDDLPEAPDAAFVAVNRRDTISAVAAIAARGAGGAVCFASGFGETGDGGALQSQLVEAAGPMPIVGPNCYGFVNYLDRVALWPDVHGGRPVGQGVAILTQSSNLLINITMARRGLPLAYAVAVGNQAQLTSSAIAAALIEDPRVTAIGLHLEGVGDAGEVEALAAAARAARKPVVALKIGRSESARVAALSHTASLTGSETVGRAFMSRLGIAVLDTLPAFLETLKLAHVHGTLSGNRMVALSCSGGEAALLADRAEGRALVFPPFAPATADRLAGVLGDYLHIANPLDYHTHVWGDGARMGEAFATAFSGGADLGAVVLDFPRRDRCATSGWACATEALRLAATRAGMPLAVLSTLPDTLDEADAEPLIAAGIAPLAGFDEGLAAIEAAAAIGRSWAAAPALPVLRPTTVELRPGRRLLDERTAKLSLAAHGVAVPAGRFAATVDEAEAAAVALGGPVALKALGIAHKTEQSALRLGLSGPREVREAARTMAAPEGFLVEAMVEGAVAELLVGILRDPVFGFALTLGSGGTLTELLADSRTLMLPVSVREVEAALAELRIAPLLAGFRGRPPADLRAVTAAVLALQSYAMAEADRLVELDVNPLIATSSAAFAADALIVLDGVEARAPASPQFPTRPAPEAPQ